MIKFELEGQLKTGPTGKMLVNGEEFILDEQTWVFGNIANGAHASVQGVFGNGGERYATKIVIK